MQQQVHRRESRRDQAQTSSYLLPVESYREWLILLTTLFTTHMSYYQPGKFTEVLVFKVCIEVKLSRYGVLI